MTANEDLTKEINPQDSKLKEIIVDFVGNYLNPETEKITVEDIIHVFSEEFPEFLLATAEENWVSGYTQALNDVQYIEKQRTKSK